MPPAQTQHPADGRLAEFAQGRLEGAEFAAIESHLGACDACCERIARQPENTLLALARQAVTIGMLAPEPGQSLDGELPAPLANHPRYRLLEQIGAGGMGTVYKAEHRLMNRLVAVKMIHPRLLAHPQAVERFEREVRVAAKLAHPNIVVSHDAERADDRHFLVMEFVEGESLAEWVGKRGPVSVRQACEWMQQAALGLQHAHEQGMAHRDIKPHNLMVAKDGQIKILDFGLSRLVDDQPLPPSAGLPNGKLPASATRSDMVLGTPDYIAPEQIGGSRTADIRADIYSLGCTFYFALTGRAPFADRSLADKFVAHQKSPLPLISASRSDSPRRLDEIVARMTAKRPADRYARPADVAADLAALLAAPQQIAPVAAGVAHPLMGRKRPGFVWRSRWGALALACAAAAVLAIFALLSGLFTPAATVAPRLLVMLPSTELWFPDYSELVDAAAGGNARLTFASIADRPSELLHTSPPGIAVPDVRLGPEVRAADYDAIVFIGYGSREFLPGGAAGDDAKRLLNEFQMQKKIVASLCAGQRILAQLGALRGKRVAPCESVRPDEIKVEGGVRTDSQVVSDGLVITAASPQDAREFVQAIRKSLSP